MADNGLIRVATDSGELARYEEVLLRRDKLRKEAENCHLEFLRVFGDLIVISCIRKKDGLHIQEIFQSMKIQREMFIFYLKLLKVKVKKCFRLEVLEMATTFALILTTKTKSFYGNMRMTL
jgi:hypothetical protein